MKQSHCNWKRDW